jgi:hypothetical protein
MNETADAGLENASKAAKVKERIMRTYSRRGKISNKEPPSVRRAH